MNLPMKSPYEIDPITLEVLRGQLDSVVNEAQDVLLRSSFSTIVTEGGDATVALHDERGRTISQACGIPIHLGTLGILGRRFAEVYPEGTAKEGDLYLINDPYDGGTHLPDFAVAAPIFFDDRLIGYITSMTHHQDIGGVAPGSLAPNPYDLLAEGLRIPMVCLAAAGKKNVDLISLLMANSRSPRNIKGDLDAQIASCRTGELRFQTVFERLGWETTQRGLNALLDYSEKLTRAAIEQIPDGEYECEDWLDDDGLSADAPPVKVRCKIKVRGSDVEFDFTGTDPQVRSSINCVPSSTLSAVYFVIRAVTGDQAPNNDGCFRPISVVMPEGSLVNPDFPAPVAARGVGLLRVSDVVFGAMAKAIPQKMVAAGSGHTTVIPAGGFDATTGERFIGTMGGPLRSGTGTRSAKDGIDVCDHGLSNAFHIPLEIAESRLPIRYRRLQLWRDSGGAGTWRGGLGFVNEVEWLRGEALMTFRLERQKFHPFGIVGGGDAPLCRLEITRADGSAEDIYGKAVTTVRRGDVVTIWSTGGGGYGNPLRRNPQSVVEDVLDERVSREAASDSYGVVMHGSRLDMDATSLLRMGP